MPAPRTTEELCARPGLSATDRIFVVLSCALVRSDSPLLVAAARLGLQRGLTAPDLREVCLQGIAYAGFPRALAALEAVSELLTPDEDPDELLPTRAEILKRGWAHFGAVYGEHRDKLYERMSALDPTFAKLTLGVAYGHLLSRNRISGKTRELMGVACLSLLEQERQMVAHAFGARNFGASDEEVVEAARTAALLFEDVEALGHADLVLMQLGGE